MIAGIVRKIVHTHVHVGCGRGVSLWMTGDDSSKLIGFDGQPLLLFWPSTISNTQCQFHKLNVCLFVCLNGQT